MEKVRVLVADDDDFTRTLVASLTKSLGLEVVATAKGVSEALALAHDTKPELALLDLDLGEGPTGIDLAHGLRKLNPRIAIVMLTSYGDPMWLGQNRQLPIGARYVVKGDMNDESVLAEAIMLALAEPCAQSIVRHIPTPVSAGQWETLRLVAAGYTNAEIARRRSLTEDSVNKAVTRLVRQLEIDPGTSGNARVLLTQAYNRIAGTVSDRRA